MRNKIMYGICCFALGYLISACLNGKITQAENDPVKIKMNMETQQASAPVLPGWKLDEIQEGIGYYYVEK